MGIVFITIPGESKRAFAEALHERTGGKVDLVIVQKPRDLSLLERFKRFYGVTGFWNFPRELWYAFLLRASTKAGAALEYFRESTIRATQAPTRFPRVLEVDSVNSDEAYHALQKLSPDLMVIWGSAILKPHIISTAKQAINLHMGLCPYYRGALANQYAVLQNDLSRVGATIHYAAQGVDRGDILATLRGDSSKPPKELFRELNDAAFQKYLEVASALFAGDAIPVTSQNALAGKNLLLKEWTPKLRYAVATRILDWERKAFTAPVTGAQRIAENSAQRSSSEIK